MLRKLYQAEVQSNLKPVPTAVVDVPAVIHYRDCDVTRCNCFERKSEHTTKLTALSKASGQGRTAEKKVENPVVVEALAQKPTTKTQNPKKAAVVEEAKPQKALEDNKAEELTPRGQILAGKHTVLAEEVFQVAVYDFDVKLDTAALAELEQKVAGNPKICELAQLPTSTSNAWDPTNCQQTRAILFVRLIDFLQGRAGVRPQVVEFITKLLNARVQLHVSSLHSLLPYFFPACNLPCIYNRVPTSFNETELLGPGLTQLEVNAFVSGVVVNSAFLALSTHALQVPCFTLFYVQRSTLRLALTWPML